MATRRGDIAKQTVTDTIINAFGDKIAGIENKKIYVNISEGDKVVQIAISLTVPKTPIAVSTGIAFDEADQPRTTTHTPIDISPEDRIAVEMLNQKLHII